MLYGGSGYDQCEGNKVISLFAGILDVVICGSSEGGGAVVGGDMIGLGDVVFSGDVLCWRLVWGSLEM